MDLPDELKNKAVYRNELIPDWNFVQKLKKIDPMLFVVYDSVGWRWHIYFKDREGGLHLVYRVCEKNSQGQDVGYRPLDDRTIRDLTRYDLARRNVSPEKYKEKVIQAERENEEKSLKRLNEYDDYILKHEKHNMARALDALKGVYRKH